MWVDLGIFDPFALVRQYVLYRPDGEHDEREGGPRGVEPVGAVDDQADAAIQALVLGIGESEPDGGQDARAVRADRLRQGDEGLQPRTLRLGAEAVEELAHLLLGEVPLEDRAQGLLQGVRAPDSPAVTAD